MAFLDTGQSKELLQCGICQEKFSLIYNFYQHFREHKVCLHDDPVTEMNRALDMCTTGFCTESHSTNYRKESALEKTDTMSFDPLCSVNEEHKTEDTSTAGSRQECSYQLEKQCFKCAACKQLFPTLCALISHLNKESFYYCKETRTCIPRTLSCCFSGDSNFFISIELHRKREGENIESDIERNEESICSAVQTDSSDGIHNSCLASQITAKDGDIIEVVTHEPTDTGSDSGNLRQGIDDKSKLVPDSIDDVIDDGVTVTHNKTLSDGKMTDHAMNGLPCTDKTSLVVLQNRLRSVLTDSVTLDSCSEHQSSDNQCILNCDVLIGERSTDENALNQIVVALDIDEVVCDSHVEVDNVGSDDVRRKDNAIHTCEERMENFDGCLPKKENELLNTSDTFRKKKLERQSVYSSIRVENVEKGNIHVHAPETCTQEEFTNIIRKSPSSSKQEPMSTEKTSFNVISASEFKIEIVEDPQLDKVRANEGKKTRGRPRKPDNELKYPRKQKYIPVLRKEGHGKGLKLNRDEKVECSNCGKLIMRKNLPNHVKVCTMDRQFSCDKCTASFATRGALVSHRKCVHDKANRYQCEVCGASFFVPSKLAKHLRNHTGERSFVCSYCNKTFKHIEYLRKHEKLHSGIKDQVCSTCGKMFYTQWNLSQHELTHRDIRAYQCTRCQRNFTTKRSLKKHHEACGQTIVDLLS